MNNNKSSNTSNKKKILNFDVNEWKVDMPAERRLPPPVTPPPKKTTINTVPKNNYSQPEVVFNPPVLPSPEPPKKVDIDDDDRGSKKHKKKKSHAWIWILLIIAISCGLVAFVVNGGIEDVKNMFVETVTVSPVEQQLDNMKNGDLIVFGSYPQAQVRDSQLLQNLAAQESSLQWQSYSYYVGEGYPDDGKNNGIYGNATREDYMMYADIEYDGNKYRAVKFTQYRPKNAAMKSSAETSLQDDYGYQPNTVYWFVYQPLTWRVLDAEKGLMLCENVVTATEFQGYVYTNKSTEGYEPREYYKSSLFYACGYFSNSAFTVEDAKYINPVSTSQNDTTKSLAYVLSSKDIVNTSYGFDASSETTGGLRCAKVTDYARCQGVLADSQGKASWWLRSSTVTSKDNQLIHADIIHRNGNIDTYLLTGTDVGLRPAIILKNPNK